MGLVGGAFLAAAFSAMEQQNLVARHEALVNHVQKIDNFIQEEHKSVIEVVDSLHSIYEYTHHEFYEVSKALRNITCREAADVEALYNMWKRDRLMQKFYTDRSSAVSAVFEGKPTPILIPRDTLNVLVEKNSGWFEGTIYQQNMDMIYLMGAIIPVMPLSDIAVAYTLRLPRLMQPSLTTMYCVRNLGVIYQQALIQFSLSEKLALIDENFKAVDVNVCYSSNELSYVCSENLHMNKVPCLKNLSSCEYKVRVFSRTTWVSSTYGYLLNTNSSCQIISRESRQHVNFEKGFGYVPFTKNGAVTCGDGTTLPMDQREFDTPSTTQ